MLVYLLFFYDVFVLFIYLFCFVYFFLELHVAVKNVLFSVSFFFPYFSISYQLREAALFLPYSIKPGGDVSPTKNGSSGHLSKSPHLLTTAVSPLCDLARGLDVY